MQPITGFLLYIAAAVVVAVVASKRGRRGWVFGLAVLIAGPVAVVVASGAGAGPVAAAWVAFGVPVAGLFAALAVKSGDEVAAETGSYRGQRKCPHCAESIKAEARVCKHCGRDVASP